MILNDAIAAFLTSKERGGRSPRTIDSYDERLQTFSNMYGKKELSVLNEELIEKWAGKEYKRELSPATIAGRIGAVKIFIKWCFDRRLIDADIAYHLIKPSYKGRIAPKAMNPEDFLALVEFAIDNANKRDLAILLMLGDTGCRVGELCNIQLTDLSLTELTAVVDGKSGFRFIDYTEFTAICISEWLTIRPVVNHDFLFTSINNRSNGQPITPNGVRLMLKRRGAGAGIQGHINPHSLRHMLGSLWAKQGVPLAIIQKKLGHSNLSTTSIYTQQNIQEVQKYTSSSSLSNLIGGNDNNE